MEHRVLLSSEEAHAMSEKLEFINTSYVRDEYTGTKRTRLSPQGKAEKVYETPVSGVIHRFSSLCKLDDIENIWFEVKWTDKVTRFEVEFEGKVPSEYKVRPNIKGWQILQEV